MTTGQPEVCYGARCQYSDAILKKVLRQHWAVMQHFIYKIRNTWHREITKINATWENWTPDPWFTRPVLCHWAKEAYTIAAHVEYYQTWAHDFPVLHGRAGFLSIGAGTWKILTSNIMPIMKFYSQLESYNSKFLLGAMNYVRWKLVQLNTFDIVFQKPFRKSFSRSFH